MTGRRIGLGPVRLARAAEQLQRAQPAGKVQPLPAGQPGRVTGAQVGIKDSPAISFLAVGDTGGVADPSRQKAVAAAMQAVSPAPAFLYHLGDVDYFNGELAEIAPQFFEPYAHLPVPIVAIPGNHDGDALPGDTSLSTFLATFCAPRPALPAGNEEYGRDVQTQPWVDWTLELDAVTIIGLYSNVPSGGHLYPEQITWLTGELKAAPADRPLIVAVHHPPLSVDAHHGGSAAMGAWLDGAFTAAGRWPELVMSGHVHDYQRFARTVNGHQVAYLVAGNGGYHNLHAFAPDAKPGLKLPGGVTFEAGDDTGWGFALLTASTSGIDGEYVAVNKAGAVTRGADKFSIPVQGPAQQRKDGSMPSPALTPTYILAAIAAVVSLFVTQNVIDNGTAQLVTGLASVFVPLVVVLAESIIKGHQTQAASRLEAARIQAAAAVASPAARVRPPRAGK